LKSPTEYIDRRTENKHALQIWYLKSKRYVYSKLFALWHVSRHSFGMLFPYLAAAAAAAAAAGQSGYLDCKKGDGRPHERERER
jgi:hypothetical protein